MSEGASCVRTAALAQEDARRTRGRDPLPTEGDERSAGGAFAPLEAMTRIGTLTTWRRTQGPGAIRVGFLRVHGEYPYGGIQFQRRPPRERSWLRTGLARVSHCAVATKGV
jgi:hypothetical protein